MTSVQPIQINVIEGRNVERWLRHEQSQLFAFRRLYILKRAEAIQPVYTRPVWVRFLWKAACVPVCCLPCGLCSCAGRILFWRHDGLTKGSDSCIEMACNAVDATEYDEYEWIASLERSSTETAAVRDILGQWVAIAESLTAATLSNTLTKPVTQVTLPIKPIAKPNNLYLVPLVSVLQRIANICAFMTYNKQFSNVVYAINQATSKIKIAPDSSASVTRVIEALQQTRKFCLAS